MHNNYLNRMLLVALLSIILVCPSCNKDADLTSDFEIYSDQKQEVEEKSENETENPDTTNSPEPIIDDKFVVPEGSRFVTVDGVSNNDGLSENSPWNIEYAFQNAKAGDNIYIKAGDYGSVELKTAFAGFSGSPIKFIGYKEFPGDIVANNGSTFEYGDSLDANKMPLISGTRINQEGQGSGIFSFHPYIEISNIQITHYEQGIFSSGDYNVLDNIIVTEVGDFNPEHTFPNRTSNPSLNYSGVGINMSGDYSVIKNSFVLNAGAEGFRFAGCEFQKHSFNKVYSDNIINPCDYYYLLALGAHDNELSNVYVERVGDLEHVGHGIVLKFDAKRNIVKNSTVKNTWLELSYSEVAENQFINCTVTGDPENKNTYIKNGALLIANGAHNNVFTNCKVTDCDGVCFSDWDEDFSRGDVKNAGHHNTFNECTFEGNKAGIFFFWFSQENPNSPAHDNTFNSCTFRNMENLFLVDRVNSNTILEDCTIDNVVNLKSSYLSNLHSNIPLDVTYKNNTVTNCDFTIN